MNSAIDRLLTRYDEGRITRRELLATLSALTVGASAAQAAEPAIGAVSQLNHVTMFVKDVQKSMAFYQRLFAMPLLTPQEPGMNLKAGAGFLGIYPSQDRPAGINHVCLGIERFDADRVLAQLKSEGLEANIRLRGDTKELYFNDPDGIRVQLQDVRYIGGVGVLGDRPPK
jgi:catechol 2,3-dioxygenase-like lactoylglutathione lyase family enzyme